MDRRAREYVRGGQRLLASDLVFSDGIEKMDAAVAAIERAQAAERAAADSAIKARRQEQLLAVGGAAALGVLIVFVLVPLPRAEAPRERRVGRARARRRRSEPRRRWQSRCTPAPPGHAVITPPDPAPTRAAGTCAAQRSPLRQRPRVPESIWRASRRCAATSRVSSTRGRCRPHWSAPPRSSTHRGW